MFFYPFSLLSSEMFVFMFSTFVNDSVFHNVVVDEQQHTVILSFDGFYVLIFRGVMLLLSGKRTKKQLRFLLTLLTFSSFGPSGSQSVQCCAGSNSSGLFFWWSRLCFVVA